MSFTLHLVPWPWFWYRPKQLCVRGKLKAMGFAIHLFSWSWFWWSPWPRPLPILMTFLCIHSENWNACIYEHFSFQNAHITFLIFYHDTQELPNLYPSGIPAKTFNFLGFRVFKSLGFTLGNALGSSHSQNNGPLVSDLWGQFFRLHPTIGHYLIHKASSYIILFFNIFLISHWAEIFLFANVTMML